jgi:SAM-dependent methyltransferase
MRPEEYTNLERVEREHWYYQGKRQIAELWLRRGGPVSRDSTLVDVGAGTGAFAASMSAHCRVIAVDDYPQSLEILRRRLGEKSVIAASSTALPLPDGSADFVTALDVLEHVEDDQKAMSEIWRILKPGGVAVVTVPALMCLWSDWDESLLHQRRYGKCQLRRLVGEKDGKILSINFMNFFAFPAVWLARRLRESGSTKGRERAEDRIPPAPVNEVLRKLFVWSSAQTLIQWPFGVGLLCVAKKS